MTQPDAINGISETIEARISLVRYKTNRDLPAGDPETLVVEGRHVRVPSITSHPHCASPPPSRCRRADAIHVMEDDRIVESGTYDDLLARGGSFSELHRLQFA